MDRRNQKTSPPGLRNNNPGNIRLTNINWLGKVPNQQNTSGVHEQFTASRYGFRALMKQIKTTLSRTGSDPLDFVKDYAAGSSPEVLNNYANFIKSKTGPTMKTDRAGLIKAAKAITIFENGTPGNDFADIEYQRGYDLLNETSNPATFNPLLAVGLLGAIVLYLSHR